VFLQLKTMAKTTDSGVDAHENGHQKSAIAKVQTEWSFDE